MSTLNMKDLVIVTPIVPMSCESILSEMEKQGLRPLTVEELEALLKSKGIEDSKTLGLDEDHWKKTPDRHLFLRE